MNVFSNMWHKIVEILSTVWGWLLFICGSVINVFVGYRAAIVLVTFMMLADMFWGIAAARSQGKFVQSELLRATFYKICGNYFALIFAVLIEQVVGWDWFVATNTIAALMGVAEFISIGGNILIVNPNMPFFKLMRSALTGEIARKLGRSEEEVKQAFEKEDDVKKRKKK